MGRMPFIYNDGGRDAAGFKGKAGDCVTRAICIAAQLPYADVYAALAEGTGAQRKSTRTAKRAASARNGINTRRKWFRDYMAQLGWKWTPTMLVGQGCKVHLALGELPQGRLIVTVSNHYTAVIDGVVHDTYDPQRDGDRYWDVVKQDWVQMGGRCVYGYWQKDI